MNPVLLEPAYVLHRRAYRENSFILEIFSQQYGRVALIAKGVRKTSAPGLLQAFTPLIMSWSGKNELKTLVAVEARSPIYTLARKCLYAGFYLNELLLGLLQKYDPHPNLFTHYENALKGLQSEQLDEKVLRIFEKQLLEALGYGLLPKGNKAVQESLLANRYYQFVPDQGLIEVEYQENNKHCLFVGDRLLAIAEEQWEDHATIQDAKRLMRLMLNVLLESKPLNSRQLYL